MVGGGNAVGVGWVGAWEHPVHHPVGLCIHSPAASPICPSWCLHLSGGSDSVSVIAYPSASSALWAGFPRAL